MQYNFPIIRNLNDLLPQIEKFDYLVATKKDYDTTTVSYIYTDKDSFSSEWERECRGITFAPDGTILSRTLHKFFNLNEKESYLAKNLDFSEIKAIFPKLDGSMISSCLLDNRVLLKSKNSFSSDVAISAQSFIDIPENKEYIRFCRDLALRGLTPTFEYTSPQNRIVVSYDSEALTLLAIRDNVTGVYLDIHEESRSYDINVITYAYDNTKSIEELVIEMESMIGVEGFIILFNNGDMVKIKCPWYIGLHRSVTFIRVRDIAKLVCSQSLDDLRSLITLGKYDGINMEKIDLIEKTIMNEVFNIDKLIKFHLSYIKENFGDKGFKEAYFYLNETLDRKDKVLITLILSTMRGQSINLLEYYRKHRLNDAWDLSQI